MRTGSGVHVGGVSVDGATRLATWLRSAPADVRRTISIATTDVAQPAWGTHSGDAPPSYPDRLTLEEKSLTFVLTSARGGYRHAMPFAQSAVAVATLPLRMGVAFTRTTLELGRLSSPDGPILRPGGYGERFAVLRELTSPDRPWAGAGQGRRGRPAARGRRAAGPADAGRRRDRAARWPRTAPSSGILADDGALQRLLAEGGALEQLVAEDGVLDRLLAAGGALDRVTAPGGVLDKVLDPGGLADRMLTDDGFVEKLIAEGGTLDQLIELGDTLESIRPRLVQLAELIPDLSTSVDALGRSVEPLGELASRIPLRGARDGQRRHPPRDERPQRPRVVSDRTLAVPLDGVPDRLAHDPVARSGSRAYTLVVVVVLPGRLGLHRQRGPRPAWLSFIAPGRSTGHLMPAGLAA